MRGLVFVLMLITGLLVFGCIGTPAEQPPAGGTGPAGGEPTGPAGGPPAGPAEGEETQPPAQPPQEPPGQEEEPTGGLDLEGLTYLELAALGVPIECDITTTYQGEAQTAKMYMAGEDKIRYESTYGGETMIVFMVDEITYMTNFMAAEYPECQWLKMVPEETEPTEPTGTYTPETAPDFEDMPATDFDCKAWAYDGSKFIPPTQNVCTMDEFTEKIMEGYDIPG